MHLPVTGKLNRPARVLLWLEPLVYLVVLYAFWQPDPNRVWALLLLIPIWALRWAATRRLLTLTPILLMAGVLLVLGVISLFTAPYSRGTVSISPQGFLALFGVQAAGGAGVNAAWAWVMLMRLLLGVFLMIAIVEHVRMSGDLRSIMIMTALLGLLVGGAALVASQWNEKSLQFLAFTNWLPNWRDRLSGGFNANEIAGAMTWLLPLMAAATLWRQAGRWRWLFAFTAGVLLLAMFLGQSRFALVGILAALVLIAVLRMRGRARIVVIALLAFYTALEVAVELQVFAPALRSEQDARDERGTTNRLAMWNAALNIVRDHPLTGVGINMYRDASVRQVYPVRTYEQRVLPHAHNEIIQAAVDLGIPGAVVFLSFYFAGAWMVWRCWQTGDPDTRTLAVGAGAALIAHAAFGMGDAVTLWDRFAFIFWWVFGILAAQYILALYARQGDDSARG